MYTKHYASTLFESGWTRPHSVSAQNCVRVFLARVSLTGFAAMLWGRSVRSAILWVQHPEGRSPRIPQDQWIATAPAARIWVQNGKIMGFVAQHVNLNHKMAVTATLCFRFPPPLLPESADVRGVEFSRDIPRPLRRARNTTDGESRVAPYAVGNSRWHAHIPVAPFSGRVADPTLPADRGLPQNLTLNPFD
jgi:hypothetical protein